MFASSTSRFSSDCRGLFTAVILGEALILVAVASPA
jgi:hypothetical protein